MLSAADLPRPTATYHTNTYDRLSRNHGFNGHGKTVFITGGAGGIGYHTAEAFAQTDVARIAIVARSADSLDQAKKTLEEAYPQTQVLIYCASITDTNKMTAIFHELGQVDVVVLNAAVAHRRATASEINVSEIQDAFDINTVAAFHIISTYLNTPMDLVDGKTVVSVSAFAAYLGSPYRIGYGPSKAAAAQMIQQFAAEQANNSVRLFSYHPGSIYTPGVAQNIPKDMIAWDDNKLPAHFARWLAGPQSSFLNGRFVWANWDVDELVALEERMKKEPAFLTIGLIM